MKEKYTHKDAFNNISMFSDKQHDTVRQELCKIFNQLQTKIPTLTKESESDGYFIFEQHILYFTDTRIPEWYFALWATYDDHNNFIGCKYIGEHDYLIDKFKPSRTWISTSNQDEFAQTLQTIIDHPYECYYASKYFMKDIDEIKPETDCKKEYEKDMQRKKDKAAISIESEIAAKEIYPTHILQMVPYVTGVGLYDFEHYGGTSWPRFSMHVSVPVKILKKFGADKIFDDIDQALENITNIHMKKYNDSEFTEANRHIIGYCSEIVTSYTYLFRNCHYVKYRKKVKK